LSVRIRLRRCGKTKRPYYRLVAADSRFPRDGRFLEILGHFQPVENPQVINVNHDRILHWLSNGALPTLAARKVLRRAGVLKRWHELKLQRIKNLGLDLPPSPSEPNVTEPTE